MPRPEIEPGEHEIHTFRANRTQGNRAVGGHVLLTNRRICFYPHKFDDLTGGDSWQCELSSVSSVGLSARGANPFNGSLRRRVQINCGDSVEYFVMNKQNKVISAVEEAVAALGRA